MELKKNKYLIIFFVVLVVILLIILNFDFETENNEEYYEETESLSLKKYEENEYIPVNITYDQMARIYLQDYVYKLYLFPEEAYNLLDETYRKARFSSYDDFLEYANSLDSLQFRSMTVVDYAFTEGASFNDFDVHDLDGNLFIFREKGVMQYSVFFDRNTVDMK